MVIITSKQYLVVSEHNFKLMATIFVDDVKVNEIEIISTYIGDPDSSSIHTQNVFNRRCELIKALYKGTKTFPEVQMEWHSCEDI